MIASLGTYRPLRVLVTLALVLGVSLPLVRYACGMTLETAIATPLSAIGTSQHTPECQHLPAGVSATLCPTHATSCTAADHEAPCTTSEAVGADKASTTESRVALAQVLLPAVALLATAPLPSDTSPSLSARRGAETTARHPSVPVRLLFSILLL